MGTLKEELERALADPRKYLEEKRAEQRAADAKRIADGYAEREAMKRGLGIGLSPEEDADLRRRCREAVEKARETAHKQKGG